MKLALIAINENSTDPPLGLAYISAYIKKYSKNKDVIIIDQEKDPIGKIKKEKPDLIGISAITIEFPVANELAAQIKKVTKVPLIIGGRHISLRPQDFEKSNFDIAVIGEGEQTMKELFEFLSEISDKKSIEEIDGLAFKKNGLIHFTKPRACIENLDIIPFPDRDAVTRMEDVYLLPRKTDVVKGFAKCTTILTSRGCPYNCTFCSSIKMWKKARLFSAEYVVDEIELLIKKYKVEIIYIVDDLFVISRERVKRITELIQQKGLNKKIKFSLMCRVNLIDEMILSYLKQMNVVHISFGFESGSERILNYLKKGAVTLKQNEDAIKLCRKTGSIKVAGSFIIGSPNETKDDMQKTLDFIKKYKLDNVGIFQLVPLPGTEVLDYALKNGLVTEENYNQQLSPYHIESFKFDYGTLLTKNISKKEFEEINAQCQKLKEQTFKVKFELKYLKYLSDWRTWLKLIKSKNICNYIRIKK